MVRAKKERSITAYYSPRLYFRQAGTLFFLVMLSFALISCMPMKDEEVNVELFENKEDMKTRTANLKRGMSKLEVLEELDVPYAKFDAMDTQEIQAAVYGNSQVQGSPDQLEKFSRRLLAYEGLTLPYRHIESAGSIGFGKMKIDKTGHDLQLVLIFEQNKLLKASIVGNEELEFSEDQYIWNALIKSGVGRIL